MHRMALSDDDLRQFGTDGYPGTAVLIRMEFDGKVTACVLPLTRQDGW